MEIITILTNTAIENWQIIIAFFVIAVLYSSVGFGGGSSYLAILSLFSLPFVQIRAIALICNIIVVSVNILGFIKNNSYVWKKVLPLALVSVPLAFIGGRININQQYFTILLAVTLIIAAIFMLMANTVKNKEKTTRENSYKDFSFGGIVGFTSGMVGIGGGIFLAPLLHLTKWDTPKKIAATSSLFIFVNSIAGLIGQSQNPQFTFEPYLTSSLILTVFVGGQIGSRMQEKIISPNLLKNLTAGLVLLVGIRLLFKYFL